MIVDCALYRDGQRTTDLRRPDELSDVERIHGDFVWLGLHEPSAAEFADAAEHFGLHELAVEDAVHAHQRPKLETYGESLFLVVKTARYDDATETVEIGEIQVFLGADFIVVVRHGSAAELASLRRDLERDPDTLRRGPSAVLHAIVDRVVDRYEPVSEGLDLDIDEVELDVFRSPRPTDVERIYKLKREVLEVLRATRPLRAPLERLSTFPFGLIDPEVRNYFRDVHDHSMRVTEALETYRDLLTSILDANLAQVSVQQNEDMRRISAWVAIAAVPTMLAGIWGMNFQHMPETDLLLGYPIALGTMVAAGVTLWVMLRRAGWL